jgi:asparagine synthase (glutamine-hydrolysing)
MNAALAHRGPDSSGIWVAPGATTGIAHTRLSILDLSDAASQPMTLEDRGLAMAFNGEIYNYYALRRELADLGHRFKGCGDSETLLHAFAQWGPGCFRRLSGMFAVAFVDERRGKLYLARDRLGIKPLFYAHCDGALVFASEIKAILASGIVRTQIDFSQIAELMYFGVTLGEVTMFDGIRRLPPGSCAEFDIATGRMQISSFWRIEELLDPGDEPPRPECEQAGALRSLLEDAVRSHLLSDVPVGVFLSGGIDSSAIVGLAAPHYGGRLRTYSVGFDYIADQDELPRARLVAERFGTEHHELRITGTNLRDLLPRLVAAHDLPFSDAANIPLYQLCEALNGETKVVLQGDGGDELFGGYRRYELLDRIRWLHPLAAAAKPLLSLGPLPARLRPMRRMAAALAEPDVAKRMALLLTVEEESESPLRVLSPELRHLASKQDPFRRYRDCARRVAAVDPVQQMLLTDLQIILPDVFLEKVDRATMAQSVEARVPFLDNALLDYAARLPAAVKVRFGAKKKLLRAALRGVVPDEILDAPKAGFGVPFVHWLRGPAGDLLADLALDPGSAASELFDRRVLEGALRQHRSRAVDHGFLLWKCLQLALWRVVVVNRPGGYPAQTS